MSQYKALLVDDSKDMRNILVGYLSLVDIEAIAFKTAEELLAYLFPSAFMELEDMPDLIVIDLQLQKDEFSMYGHCQQPKKEKDSMDGLGLIRELLRPQKNVPSSLMAISGVYPVSAFFQDVMMFGIPVFISKTLQSDLFCRIAKRMAKIGKKRRLTLINKKYNIPSHIDDSRLDRPAFISFACEEEVIANGIRINLESRGLDVWYGPTTLDVGDNWVQKIKDGIDQASIFIPIFSDNYLLSQMCLEELNRFQMRLVNDERGDLSLLPLIYELSVKGRGSEVFRSVADKYHCLDILPRFDECLTSLIWKIDKHLEKNRILVDIGASVDMGVGIAL